MRATARSLWVGLLALLGAVVVTISWTMTTAVQLQATTALIMGGTDNPDPDATYIADITQRYLNPFADLPYDPPPVGVHTPEQFFPVFGSQTFDDSVAEGVLDLQDAIDVNTPNAGDRVIIVGYSQSARIATIAKRHFIENYDPADPDATPISGFVMLANPGKPNGGILERYKLFGTIPFFGITFDGDTPTNGPQNPDGSYVAPTKDISFLYDGVSDHPVWSLNFLALANALAGYVYLHGETPTADDDLIYQGSAGDTDYYVIDSGIVPILRPLGSLGVPHFLLSALNEPVQVLIESAFRRDLGPGVPVQASLLPHVNPITLAINLIKSIPVGIDNALEELGVGRKLGTTPSGPYGVGGPQLPAPPVTAMTTVSALSASEAVEPDAPQVDSLAKDAGTRKSNDAETASAEPDTTPAPDPEPKTKPAAAEKKPKPPAKEADQPEVRGPIEFDSQKTPTESPSSPSGGQAATGDTSATETKSTTTPDSTSSPGSETKDAA
jgi:hypothetical protein